MIRSITSGVSAKNANPKQNDATLIIPDKINTKAGSSRAHWPYKIKKEKSKKKTTRKNTCPSCLSKVETAAPLSDDGKTPSETLVWDPALEVG
jgi:hypothetical protein